MRFQESTRTESVVLRLNEAHAHTRVPLMLYVKKSRREKKEKAKGKGSEGTRSERHWGGRKEDSYFKIKQNYRYDVRITFSQGSDIMSLLGDPNNPNDNNWIPYLGFYARKQKNGKPITTKTSFITPEVNTRSDIIYEINWMNKNPFVEPIVKQIIEID